jgi:hypothetical protein
MLSHAKAKHNLPSGGPKMRRYRGRCSQLSCAGSRVTTKGRVLQLMGRFAVSKSHYLVAKRVLEGHLVDVVAKCVSIGF